MALIETVKPEQAEGQAREIYDTMQDTVGVIPAPLQLASASCWMLGMVWQSIPAAMFCRLFPHGSFAGNGQSTYVDGQ